LGFDGSDFRALRIDNQSDGVWAQRTSLVPDRAMAKVVGEYVAALTAHITTLRYTYTVGTGKRALLEAVNLYIDALTASATGYVDVLVNDKEMFGLYYVVGVAISGSRMVTWGCQIWLTVGDTVKIYTYSNDATARTFAGRVCISEFSS
jgi:hypothetical protein